MDCFVALLLAMTTLASKVAGDALHLPVAVADGLGAVAAAEFLRRRGRGGGGATRLGFRATG